MEAKLGNRVVQRSAKASSDGDWSIGTEQKRSSTLRFFQIRVAQQSGEEAMITAVDLAEFPEEKAEMLVSVPWSELLPSRHPRPPLTLSPVAATFPDPQRTTLYDADVNAFLLWPRGSCTGELFDELPPPNPNCSDLKGSWCGVAGDHEAVRSRTPWAGAWWWTYLAKIGEDGDHLPIPSQKLNSVVWS